MSRSIGEPAAHRGASGEPPGIAHRGPVRSGAGAHRSPSSALPSLAMAEDAHEEFPEHPGYAEATALY
ncbi:MAG TPA: hypothetical protein RMI62_02810, partial [Polyangiaceae bacterium LLY-WYZ-15_(1-7)]|nr:hypothetical protein [Polyangiaceae bacterium LLY-WYZ-15_(1-7)]